MGQTRLGSAFESLVNLALGFLVALLTQVIVFPWFGLQVTFSENVALTSIFTVSSLIRSYTLRRAFNWWHLVSTPPLPELPTEEEMLALEVIKILKTQTRIHAVKYVRARTGMPLKEALDFVNQHMPSESVATRLGV